MRAGGAAIAAVPVITKDAMAARCLREGIVDLFGNGIRRADVHRTRILFTWDISTLRKRKILDFGLLNPSGLVAPGEGEARLDREAPNRGPGRRNSWQCVLIGNMMRSRLGRASERAIPVAGLLLLCFLWSLDSLGPDLIPDPSRQLVPPVVREALSLAMLAVAAGVFAAARGAEWPRRRQILGPIRVGLWMFVAPALLVSFSDGWVPRLTQVALFSLAPVLAVVLEPHLGRGMGVPSAGALPAALAAMAGILCIFPVQGPHSIEAWRAYIAMVVAVVCVAVANCWAAKIAAEAPEKSIAPMAAIAGVAGAAGLAGLSPIFVGRSWLAGSGALNWLEPAWMAAAELPGLLLLFWLMRRMSAVQMTTRYVLAPLMTVMLGMALERPAVGLSTWLGILLIASGVGWLLSTPGEREAPGLPLKLDRR